MNILLTIGLAIANLLPQAGDSFWRDSIPAEMRQSYISYGEQYADKSWTVLQWTVFAENKITGNRVNYEAICFEKRRQLAALVMAEIMEGKGRFMNDIIDGIGSFCEETWWGIPAHYSKPIPLTELQEVDLFNAETAAGGGSFQCRDSRSYRMDKVYARETVGCLFASALSAHRW